MPSDIRICYQSTVLPNLFGSAKYERVTRTSTSELRVGGGPYGDDLAGCELVAGVSAVLVSAGGTGTVQVLGRRSDLVEIWTRRSLQGADEPSSFKVARAMCETLRGSDVLEPVVVLLSHVFYGADFELPEVPSLRGLFVDYPGERVRPPLAVVCERWESLASGDVSGIEGLLGRLVG